jgi:hypothetical protein
MAPEVRTKTRKPGVRISASDAEGRNDLLIGEAVFGGEAEKAEGSSARCKEEKAEWSSGRSAEESGAVAAA